MTTTLSKARQHIAVGEGLALGCLAVGVTEVMGEKMDIEFAFRHAWRRWPHARAFPAVHAGPQRDDLLHILDRSEGRRSAHLTGWSSSWPFVPYLAEHWSIEDTAEILAGSSGVPLAGWVDLARTFVDRLGSTAATAEN